MDRLDALLQRFAVRTQMFHSGARWGVHDFAAAPPRGPLHLLRRGRLEVTAGRGPVQVVTEPTLLLYPRPYAHRFSTDPEGGADLTCAIVRFDGGTANPLAQALPEAVLMPLADLEGTSAVLEELFAEAFGAQCGRQAVVDRLFEVVLVRVLRRLLQARRVDVGLLAGLAHPQLARALVAVHERPAQEWSLAELATTAGLSRSAFAESFRRTVGCTPGEYLARWRVGLAQDHLRRGRALKWIAGEVGYGSEAALSRAFKAQCGHSPREWVRASAYAPLARARPNARPRMAGPVSDRSKSLAMDGNETLVV
jgi:AraC-like DNA-binding protein